MGFVKDLVLESTKKLGVRDGETAKCRSCWVGSLVSS